MGITPGGLTRYGGTAGSAASAGSRGGQGAARRIPLYRSSPPPSARSGRPIPAAAAATDAMNDRRLMPASFLLGTVRVSYQRFNAERRGRQSYDGDIARPRVVRSPDRLRARVARRLTLLTGALFA